MLTSDQVKDAAARLDTAERSRTQIGLLSLNYPNMTMDDAYAVQAAWNRRKIEAGRKVIGWKIGLTSRTMQAALNIDIPDSGILFDDMLFDDGATIPDKRFIQPRIEAEVAFFMRQPLKGPNVTLFDVLDATAYVMPALEILDTRIVRSDAATKKTRTIVDTIADNAANAGIILGARQMRPVDVDMRWVGAIVSRNAIVEETGLGAGVLNNPARGIMWLANRLAGYDQQIEAGQVVLSGSFIRPIEAQHGDTIHADFGSFGSVSCHFA
ncbi:2-oxo-hepta-3-ene-1,7-dioic acid hydratase [Bradyrhizobium sp. KB893862 SZCCT0404]|uniref:2-oxo-hept-4-ene-1,7-dioate hydratase n=1 Tax=Bradyrhizobium sp. KB893862 SZCCT0404 TaxID=2807672 RepID=UPI001BA90DAF|nr:2-oxo-hepta-3-ene-1,7-dioic acid hydratase [Bradyrhizobium sp. KB893862 SZCCT0404]MBR1175274.1 2-oxo-hepta-3-ene-1,7-dioic acid hydratase [Bradyrhizobium sp. KB893862 SZCCT0404]